MAEQHPQATSTMKKLGRAAWKMYSSADHYDRYGRANELQDASLLALEL
jgi:hypothetical protein